jgi:hypothetical protein
MRLLASILLLMALTASRAGSDVNPEKLAAFRLDRASCLRGFMPVKRPKGEATPSDEKAPEVLAAMEQRYLHSGSPTELRCYVLLFATQQTRDAWIKRSSATWQLRPAFNVPDASGRVPVTPTSWYYPAMSDPAKKKEFEAKTGPQMREWEKTAEKRIGSMLASAQVNRIILMVGANWNPTVRRDPKLVRKAPSDADLERTVTAVMREMVLRARKFPDNR